MRSTGHRHALIPPPARSAAAVLLAVLAISTFWSGGHPAAAGTVVTIDADRQFALAEELFARGDYPQAIAEYKRFVYFFDDDARTGRALFQIGQAHVETSQWTAAIEAFQTLIDRYDPSALAFRAYFRQSTCYLKQRNQGAALVCLHNLITAADDPDVRDEAYYRIGWIHVEMTAWQKALAAFDRIGSRNRDTYRLQTLSEELSATESIPRKDPFAAGLLSVVPGAGYLYCQRRQDALVAFLVNVGLGLAAWEAFDNDLEALGSILAVVELGFYTGNIYGAVGSAHKYNRRQSQRFVDRLKQRLRVHLGAGGGARKVTVSLGFAF